MFIGNVDGNVFCRLHRARELVACCPRSYSSNPPPRSAGLFEHEMFRAHGGLRLPRERREILAAAAAVSSRKPWPVKLLSAMLAASLCLGVGVGTSYAADAQTDHMTHAIQEAGRQFGHASHATRTLLLAILAGLRGCANTALSADGLALVCCSNPHNFADHSVQRALACLAVGLILLIPFGVPASALFVANVSVVELAKPVRVELVLAALPLVWRKAKPRIRMLRFNGGVWKERLLQSI